MRVLRATRTCPVLDGLFPYEKIQRLRPFPLACRCRRRSSRPRRLLHRRGWIPTTWTSDRPRSPLVAVRRGRRRPFDLRRCREDGRGHEREQEEEGGYAPHPGSDDDRTCPCVACRPCCGFRPCPCEAKEGSPPQKPVRWRQGVEAEEAGPPHRPPAGHSLSASRRVPRRLPAPNPFEPMPQRYVKFFPLPRSDQHPYLQPVKQNILFYGL
jgi:hypothetical protein